MKPVGLPFANTFAFSRPVVATTRNAAGALVDVAANKVRFDHDVAGVRLGMLVEGQATLGQADSCSAIAGDWEVDGAATILHEFATLGGAITRRAYYSLNGRATANILLRAEGHHRRIGIVPGLLRNRNGMVTYRDQQWSLTGQLGTGIEGEVLEDGTADHRHLVEM